jgi:hypothetical protein
MDYQKATNILKNLLDKESLNVEEKEAVFTAIGVLAWASLSKSRIKAMRNKHEEFKSGKQ